MGKPVPFPVPKEMLPLIRAAAESHMLEVVTVGWASQMDILSDENRTAIFDALLRERKRIEAELESGMRLLREN